MWHEGMRTLCARNNNDSEQATIVSTSLTTCITQQAAYTHLTSFYITNRSANH